MQTSVDLQAPFSYSIYPIIIVIALLILLTIYFFTRKNKYEKEINEIPEIKDVNLKDLKSIKEKYLKKLDEIDYNLNNNKISIRIAYQNLSIVIRFFVYEVTNIKVQHYTLKDIEKLNIPILYELIQEYYIPEFSKHSLGNIKFSLEKTRKVIEKWN